MDPQLATALFAHQGGWDEVLLVVGPIIAIGGLLMLAKRRVDAAAARPEQGDETAAEPVTST